MLLERIVLKHTYTQQVFFLELYEIELVSTTKSAKSPKTVTTTDSLLPNRISIAPPLAMSTSDEDDDDPETYPTLTLIIGRRVLTSRWQRDFITREPGVVVGVKTPVHPTCL